MRVITNQDEALENMNGTHKVGSLQGVTYWDLKNTFGTPVLDEPSGDDKTQKEWCFEFNGEYFFVYDWKTYDERYTVEELTTWSIGGTTSPFEFETMVMHLIANQPVS